MEEIGTQMVPPREIVSGYGLTGEHLVARLALCQSPRAEQHGAGSEEEALGILSVHHSYHLSACHTPGTKNLGCVVLIPGPLPPLLPHPLLSKCFMFCFVFQDQGFLSKVLEILYFLTDETSFSEWVCQVETKSVSWGFSL